MLRLKFFIPLVLALLATVTESHAIGRMTSHLYSGVIQSVDRKAHTFAVLPDGKTKPLVIAWGKEAKFFADEQPASEAILRTGIQVHVRYDDALFTGKTVIFVRWLKASGIHKNIGCLSESHLPAMAGQFRNFGERTPEKLRSFFRRDA